MSPLNVAICTTISYTLRVEIIFKKQLFDLEVKGQGPTKVITICDTPPYGHAPTYQISLTYLERQKCYGPDKKILFKNNYLTFFDLSDSYFLFPKERGYHRWALTHSSSCFKSFLLCLPFERRETYCFSLIFSSAFASSASFQRSLSGP